MMTLAQNKRYCKKTNSTGGHLYAGIDKWMIIITPSSEDITSCNPCQFRQKGKKSALYLSLVT
ncbi:MAG TPA: hypothetical protein PLT28_07580, partial [Saprospiraceae bacterium]|nr:hypothetical protein [Saprospiraceae bacterium]